MKKAVCVGVLCFVLTACGSNAVKEDPEKLGFIMVSKGKASGLSRLFGANIDYCKATQYNLQGVAFTGDIEYEGDTCTVNITAANE